MRKTLDELANLYQTDKGSGYRGASRHGYAVSYDTDKCLATLRDKPIRLLEVGVNMEGTEGVHSLKMWLDYFSQAEIYAFDILNLANHPIIKDNQRIHFYRGDQGQRSDLVKMYEFFGSDLFDVILEDGSHKENHQMISFGVLFKFVKPGGLYILEDMSIPGNKCCCIRNDLTYKTILDFQNNKTIDSIHLTDDEKAYIEQHTESIEMIPDVQNAYVTTIIRKKT